MADPTKLAVTAKTVLEHPGLMQTLRSRLGKHYEIVVPAARSQPLSAAAMVEVLDGAVGLLIGREPLDERILGRAPGLRVASVYGVGVDNIDFFACQRAGVHVVESPGVNSGAVAEFTVGLMIALLRNVASGDRLLRAGVWRKDGGTQLSGKTVGLIGLGSVGLAVAKICKAFGCKVLYHDIRLRPEAGLLGIEERSLETLLSDSDLVSLHVPSTPLSRGLINQARLEQMRRGAFLVNTSRGDCVVESDLVEALQNDHLAGAALDVFVAEPNVDPQVVRQERLLITPHIAGNAKECVIAAGIAAIEGLAKHLTDLEAVGKVADR